MAIEQQRGRRLLYCTLALIVLGGGLVAAHAGSSTGPDAPKGTVWFGPGIEADSLANTPIGGPEGGALAYAFRAPWTGVVSSIRFYLIVNPPDRGGYSGGTGGKLRISIRPSSGPGPRSLPAKTSLASIDYTPSPEGGWPLVRFPQPAHVQEGHTYFVVYTNIDPAPKENYESVNALVSVPGGARPPPNPHGFRVLLADTTDGGPTPIRWRPRAEAPRELYTPIIEIDGARKTETVGIGVMEVWSTAPGPIGGAAAVRERFTFDQAKSARVTEARIRLRRVAQGATPLQVRLETQGGRLLAESDVPAAAVRTSAAGWVVARFTDSPSIRRGMKLALVLRSEAEGSYEAFPIRDGSRFGFGPATVFRSGFAQFTSDGGWSGWDMWGTSNRDDGDLQFALKLEE